MNRHFAGVVLLAAHYLFVSAAFASERTPRAPRPSAEAKAGVEHRMLDDGAADPCFFDRVLPGPPVSNDRVIIDGVAPAGDGLFVAYREEGGEEDVFIYRSVDDGESWTYFSQFQSPASDWAYDMVVAHGSVSYLYFAFQGLDNAVYLGRKNLLDPASVWEFTFSDEFDLDSSSKQIELMTDAASFNDYYVYLVYRGDGRVRYTRSTDFGTTWEEAYYLPAGEAEDSQPGSSLAFGYTLTNARVHVMYRRESAFQQMYLYADSYGGDGASSWSAPVVLPIGGPTLMATNYDSNQLCAVEVEGETLRIHISQDEGETWTQGPAAPDSFWPMGIQASQNGDTARVWSSSHFSSNRAHTWNWNTLQWDFPVAHLRPARSISGVETSLGWAQFQSRVTADGNVPLFKPTWGPEPFGTMCWDGSLALGVSEDYTAPLIGDVTGDGLIGLITAGKVTITTKRERVWAFSGGTYLSTAMGDLDSDGVPEIVVVINGGSEGRVIAYNATRDEPGLPSISLTQKWSYSFPGFLDAAALALVVGGGGVGYALAHADQHFVVLDGATGAAVTEVFNPGWTSPMGSPAVGDLDRDGVLDVVLTRDSSPLLIGPIPEGPFVEIGPSLTLQDGVSLADVDLSGSLEIFGSDINGDLWGLFLDGSTVAGFPHSPAFPAAGTAVAALDLIDGPEPEFVYGTADGELAMVKSDGTYAQGWPVQSGFLGDGTRGMTGQPIVVDMGAGVIFGTRVTELNEMWAAGFRLDGTFLQDVQLAEDLELTGYDLPRLTQAFGDLDNSGLDDGLALYGGTFEVNVDDSGSRLGQGLARSWPMAGGNPQRTSYVPPANPVSTPGAPSRGLTLRVSQAGLGSAFSVSYTIHDDGPTDLAVYDIQGRRVVTLFQGVRASGSYTEDWAGRGASDHVVASGVYFVQLKHGRGKRTSRVSDRVVVAN